MNKINYYRPQNYVKKGVGFFKKLKTLIKTKRFWTWIVRLMALGFATIAFLFVWYSKDLPDPNRLLTRQVAQSTKILSRDGDLLYEVHGEYKRTLIPYSEMNDFVRNATIAIEDKDFYNESGINLKGIMRSVLINLVSGSKAQGGSTITQQFVRNAILTREKTWSRKIKEIILSIEINERFTKDDILKLYLNEIPYGSNAYGIEAAAQTYFNKHAKDLDLAEAAYMAALPQSPSYYQPNGSHRDALDARKNTVLSEMKKQGYITEEQYNQAKSEVVVFQKIRNRMLAPHFVQYIQSYITAKYGDANLESGGLKITTTLDLKLQEKAEKAIEDGVAKNAKAYNGNNAALVAIDPKTGQILAMVGSKDFFAESTPTGCKPGLNCTFEPEVNVATSLRQAGSSMKPYVYVTAFKPEFSQAPATLRLDVETNFGKYGNKDYIPKNYNGQVHGPVSIRQALAGSLNIPAVKTLDLIGVDNAIQTMRDVGITSPLKDCGLSLVLGGCEVTLVDHVSGYATFANEGVHHDTAGILKIEDANGNVLEEYKDQSKEVLDPQSVYELISIMTDNESRQFTFGSSSVYLTLPGRTVAAKTGTTQNFHDGWTVGFTPSLVAGVWTGNNDGTLMKTDAVITAAPIWKQFMTEALKDTPAEDFPIPDGIQNITVDALSGKLPGAYTTATKTDVFANFSVPKEYDDLHLPGGLTTLHSERPDNPSWEQPVASWAITHGYSYIPKGDMPQIPIPELPNNQIDVGSPPTITVVSPPDGSTIAQVPFILQTHVSPDTNNKITRVDLLVDGSFVQSINIDPYSFQISQQLASGLHTFALHAVDDKGNTADTSIKLRFK